MESFYTLQGEGFHQGKAAYFIRLGGCDVGCHWCDVKESWDANIHPNTKVSELLEKAQATNTKFIVVTGGEPVMYDLQDLTDEFRKNNYSLAIETSGAYSLSGDWHWICLSPKKNKPPLDDYFKVANELKVVVYNKSDFEWAEQHAKKMNSDALLFLQPEWSKREKLTPLIIDYIKKYPKWNLSIQAHKYVNIP